MTVQLHIRLLNISLAWFCWEWYLSSELVRWTNSYALVGKQACFVLAFHSEALTWIKMRRSLLTSCRINKPLLSMCNHVFMHGLGQLSQPEGSGFDSKLWTFSLSLLVVFFPFAEHSTVPQSKNTQIKLIGDSCLLLVGPSPPSQQLLG